MALSEFTWGIVAIGCISHSLQPQRERLYLLKHSSIVSSPQWHLCGYALPIRASMCSLMDIKRSRWLYSLFFYYYSEGIVCSGWCNLLFCPSHRPCPPTALRTLQTEIHVGNIYSEMWSMCIFKSPPYMWSTTFGTGRKGKPTMNKIFLASQRETNVLKAANRTRLSSCEQSRLIPLQVNMCVYQRCFCSLKKGPSSGKISHCQVLCASV